MKERRNKKQQEGDVNQNLLNIRDPKARQP